MKPLPTPYDITSIPHIPYTPGQADWLILGGFFLVVALLILAFTRVRVLRRVSPLERVKKELKQIEERGIERAAQRDLSALVSQRVKWGIDSTFGSTLHAAGIATLERLSIEHPDEEARRILGILARLDREKYAPPGPSTMTIDTVREVRDRLITIQNRGWNEGDAIRHGEDNCDD